MAGDCFIVETQTSRSDIDEPLMRYVPCEIQNDSRGYAGDPHWIRTSDPQIMNQLTILFSMLQLVTCC